MGAGLLNPLNIGLGLAKAALYCGVNIFEGSRVRYIKKGTIVQIETVKKKLVTAKFLVLSSFILLAKMFQNKHYV